MKEPKKEKNIFQQQYFSTHHFYRVVVEPARGQARGSHRDRYNDSDRYSSRRGGGRYNSDK